MHTHEVHDNLMAPWTVGAIAIHPTSNSQGGYYFYILGSSKWTNSYGWTELPKPVEVEKWEVELAMNGNCLAILGTEIWVQIAGVAHEEDSGQPEGSEDEEALGYTTADEAEHIDGQSQIQVFSGTETEDIEAEETYHDHDGPRI